MNKIENILLENKKDIDLLLKSANADNKFLQAQLLLLQWTTKQMLRLLKKVRIR